MNQDPINIDNLFGRARKVWPSPGTNLTGEYEQHLQEMLVRKLDCRNPSGCPDPNTITGLLDEPGLLVTGLLAAASIAMCLVQGIPEPPDAWSLATQIVTLTQSF